MSSERIERSPMDLVPSVAYQGSAVVPRPCQSTRGSGARPFTREDWVILGEEVESQSTH